MKRIKVTNKKNEVCKTAPEKNMVEEICMKATIPTFVKDYDVRGQPAVDKCWKLIRRKEVVFIDRVGAGVNCYKRVAKT